jgi:hypothetical protein
MGGLISTGIIALILLVVAFSTCGIVHIKGHELAIRETWNGVDHTGGPNNDGIYGPGKRMYFRFTTDYIKYDMRRHHYKMINEAQSQGDDAPDGPSYTFKVEGGQKVKVGWDIVYRYDPAELQQLHRDVRNEIPAAEKKILANPCKLIAQNLVTDKAALDIYYGTGLKDLQKDFLSQILSEDGVANAGLIIESAVVMTQLEDAYTKQIADKVVAEQKEISMAAQERANQAQAKSEKAKAEIDKNKRVIAAEAAKAEQVLAAEGQAEREVLAAEAAKKQVVLAAEADMEKERMEGEGQKLRLVAEAEGVKALKLAEAAGEEALKLAKYDGVAGQRQTSVLYVERQAAKLKGLLDGVKVLPQDAFIALMNDSGGNDVQPVINVGGEQVPVQ